MKTPLGEGRSEKAAGALGTGFQSSEKCLFLGSGQVLSLLGPALPPSCPFWGGEGSGFLTWAGVQGKDTSSPHSFPYGTLGSVAYLAETCLAAANHRPCGLSPGLPIVSLFSLFSSLA